MASPLDLPCLYCKAPLTFGHSGWVHAATGKAYVGACRCDGTKHAYSHDDTGRLVCRTWRDHHIATPDRSGGRRRARV